MAFYAWTATDVAGKTQRGTLQAEGQKQVRQMLREQKLMPVSISETREAASAGKAKTGARLSTPVLSMFTRQLSTLVNAALPLESALKAIAKQTEDKTLAAMVTEIRDKTAVLETLKDYGSAKNAVWGVNTRNREQNFAMNLLMDPEVDFVTLTGTAGTGNGSDYRSTASGTTGRGRRAGADQQRRATDQHAQGFDDQL